jgi:hypothetical protein
MDCGCFVYGATVKSKLFILDPVFNTRIHLAVGIFFIISPRVSPYVEPGEPSLSLCRNLCFSYTEKVSAQLHHPSYSVVYILPTTTGISWISAPQTVDEFLHYLLEHFGVCLSHKSTIPSKLCYPTLVAHTSYLLLLLHQMNRQLFVNLASAYSDYTVVLTDGLFVQESTGHAFMNEDQIVK